jgi:hypothetical protein
VLSVTEVRKKMMEFLKENNELFGLDDNDLLKLAKKFKWNKVKMEEGWFMQQEKKGLGIIDELL